MNFSSQWLKQATGLALILLLAGCAGKTHRAPVPTAPFLQAFLVHGTVRELRPEENSVVIQHEEVASYMPAMTMPFKLKNPQEMTGLSPGDNVSFQMVITETNGWIEGVEKLSPPAGSPLAAPTPALPTNASVRIARNVEPLSVGDTLPDYSFTNELGQAVSLSQFKGQALALTFIFTRCPFPTFCPQMSRNFAETQKKLKQLPAAPANWHLLTLSFDPEYDTPAVLKSYAQEYHADPARWNFLTGALIDITALSEQFGVQFWRVNPGEPISHNLRTVVVDAQGRVQKIFPNNNWNSDELVAEMVKAANLSKPRMTEQQVLDIAEAAMTARFPESVEAHRPYHAKFEDSNWSVWGTVPEGIRGGGAPEVVVRDSDGTVTDIHLSR